MILGDAWVLRVQIEASTTVSQLKQNIKETADHHVVSCDAMELKSYAAMRSDGRWLNTDDIVEQREDDEEELERQYQVVEQCVNPEAEVDENELVFEWQERHHWRLQRGEGKWRGANSRDHCD